LAAAALACSACAPGFFVRDTVTLDSERLGDYAIRYEPFSDCLWKQMVPTRYAVQRSGYRLELTVKPGYNSEPPQIEAGVSGATDPTLEFTGAAVQPDGSRKTDSGRSYVVSVAPRDQSLVIQVRSGGQELGQEQFSLHTRRCHGLGFGGS
jgi:hypothetical protein